MLPEYVDALPDDDDWNRLAWWIHDSLPYATLQFFPTNWAFNIGWHETPARSIYSYAKWRTGDRWQRNGYLTQSGMPNHDGDHVADWEPLCGVFDLAKSHRLLPI